MYGGGGGGGGVISPGERNGGEFSVFTDSSKEDVTIQFSAQEPPDNMNRVDLHEASGISVGMGWCVCVWGGGGVRWG